ncbi:MAG: hypothetical protein ACI3XI_09245 [Eubacteriales bacterium]
MYFLKKYGIILLTVLILLVLTLAFVILLYGYKDVLLPTFSLARESAVSDAVNLPPDFCKILSIGGTMK